jgi:nucleoside 2-deoxyribosyltransferase
MNNVEKQLFGNVYLASPFFNPDQIRRVELLENLFEENDIPYFSPMRHQHFTEDNKFDAKAIFDSNVKEVRHADVVIAVVDEKDTGTAWEIGMAYALDKRVILVLCDTHTPNKTNIMLAECGVIVHFDNLLDEYSGVNEFRLTDEDPE